MISKIFSKLKPNDDTVRNHTLMTAQAISWLNQFSHLPLNDHQRLALIYLRQHSSIDNRDYRRLNRVDVMTAGQDLRGMVQAGLLEQTGFGRWTKYINLKDAIWAGRFVEPRILEVLPAAYERFKKHFSGDADTIEKLEKIIEGIKQK